MDRKLILLKMLKQGLIEKSDMDYLLSEIEESQKKEIEDLKQKLKAV